MSLACHSRTEDDVGSAPDQGDTTEVAADTSYVEDEVGAAPDRGDTTAVSADTSYAIPSDTAMGQASSDTSMTGIDTTAVEMPNDTSIIGY